MYRNTKIATCCYCGTRAVLVLDRERHALACSACGAPLSHLKNLPVDAAVARSPDPATSPPSGKTKKPGKGKKKSKKHHGRKLRGVLSGLLDEIEDIFD